MSYNELITIALVIFAVTQVEKSIARRTADEIERRNKPQAAPAPKSKWSSVFLSPRLALIGAALGVIGLLYVVVMVCANAPTEFLWRVVASVALVVGVCMAIGGLAGRLMRRGVTAQVSTDHTAQRSAGPAIPRPGSGS